MPKNNGVLQQIFPSLNGLKKYLWGTWPTKRWSSSYLSTLSIDSASHYRARHIFHGKVSEIVCQIVRDQVSDDVGPFFQTKKCLQLGHPLSLTPWYFRTKHLMHQKCTWELSVAYSRNKALHIMLYCNLFIHYMHNYRSFYTLHAQLPSLCIWHVNILWVHLYSSFGWV
jgi:hypothetical protein